jgi:hypothetical protein
MDFHAFAANVDLIWDEPGSGPFLARMSEFVRLIDTVSRSCVFAPKTTDSSRAHPARGRRKGPDAPADLRKATAERPALAGNPPFSRLSPESRVELCKPEVTGSIPVRSTYRKPC